MNSPDHQAVPLTLSLQEIKDAEVNPEFGYFPIVMAAFVSMGVVMYEGLQVGWGTCDIEIPGNCCRLGVLENLSTAQLSGE